MKTKILIAVLLLASFLKSYATDYYVSLSGNDSNDGLSTSSPWQTINKINATFFLPGDHIFFEGNSTFIGNIFLDNTDGNNNTNPLEISSYGFGKATINGVNGNGILLYNTSGIFIDNLIIIGSGINTNTKTGINVYNDLTGDIKLDNIKITNCEVYGFSKGIEFYGNSGNSGFSNVLIENNKVHDCLKVGINVGGFFSISKVGYSNSNVTVANCEVFNIPGEPNPSMHSGSGIIVSNVVNSVIEYSVAYNCGYQNMACGGPVGIWYWDADQVTIQYCEAYNNSSGTGSGCDGGGFDLDGGVTNGTMQYNYSHDNDGAGFLVGQFSGARPMENITVRYNISQNDAATNGGSVYLFNGQNPIRNISVYNNTFYISEQPTNTSSAAVKFLNQMPINDNIVIYNNILIAENGAKLVDVPVGYSAEFLGNLYYTSSTFEIDYQGTTYSSLAAFRATGNEFSSPTNYGYEGDPLLQDAGNGGTIGFGNNLNTLSNYMLTSLSPAIDIGFAVPFTVTQDFYGNNAIINGSGDIGAHEYDTNLNVIHTELENNISLFSNPTKSIIHIKSANNMIQNLTLYNLLGKEISTVNNINSFEYELAVRGLTQSVYLVKIKTLNGSVTKRFVRN